MMTIKGKRTGNFLLMSLIIFYSLVSGIFLFMAYTAKTEAKRMEPLMAAIAFGVLIVMHSIQLMIRIARSKK